MAIIYCSWATGNDTTGTGTAANPYKTITKASTLRATGDEVRVAKSPDPTALTGTMGRLSEMYPKSVIRYGSYIRRQA